MTRPLARAPLPCTRQLFGRHKCDGHPSKLGCMCLQDGIVGWGHSLCTSSEGLSLLRKDTHHPLEEGACCDAQNAVQVVVRIEVSTRERTLRCFLGRGVVRTTGAVLRPQQRGTKSEVAASPLPSREPKRGRNCYITPAFSGVPNKGDKIKAGPKEGENATPPLHSRGSPTKGNKIRSGSLTPAFSGAQKRADLLRNPCILGGPQRQARGENQKWPFGFLGGTIALTLKKKHSLPIFFFECHVSYSHDTRKFFYVFFFFFYTS